MNSPISGSEPIEDVLLEHQFQATDGEQRAVGISLVTDYCADYDAAALAEHHANKAASKHDTDEERSAASPTCFERALHERRKRDRAEEARMEPLYRRAMAAKKSVEVRSQRHIFSSPFAWAKAAEAPGLEAGRFE
jgi:hypothetical protein